jgi:hypothetical protein
VSEPGYWEEIGEIAVFLRGRTMSGPVRDVPDLRRSNQRAREAACKCCHGAVPCACSHRCTCGWRERTVTVEQRIYASDYADGRLPVQIFGGSQ